MDPRSAEVEESAYKVQYQILRAGADVVGRALDAEAGADVIAHGTAGMEALGFFVQVIYDPGQVPDLPEVRVATELEVDAGRFCILQMIRLMIQWEGKCSGCVSQRFQRLTRTIWSN